MPFFPKDRSLTQEALDRETNAIYQKRGRDALAWQGYALSLRDSARLLWSHVDAASSDKARGERFGVMVVAMMLSGLAIEVLAKAVLVSLDPASVVGSESKFRGGKAHDLIALVAAAKLSLKSEERAVLIQLSGFVKFGGRYPIPTRPQELTPTLKRTRRYRWPVIELAPGTHISPCARPVFEAVFTRLNDRLEKPKRGRRS